MTLVFNDRRQLILDRLYVLLGNLTIPLLGGPNGASSIIPGNIVHNRNELGGNKTPGVILLDADEVRDPSVRVVPQGQQATRVRDQVMKMTPEIYVVLDVRGIENKNVGADLNLARRAILAAVLPDPTLQEIVGANGGIYYDGLVTDMARNRALKGQLGISITFAYPLLRNEYAGIQG